MATCCLTMSLKYSCIVPLEVHDVFCCQKFYSCKSYSEQPCSLYSIIYTMKQNFFKQCFKFVYTENLMSYCSNMEEQGTNTFLFLSCKINACRYPGQITLILWYGLNYTIVHSELCAGILKL